jgi:hypothetical protein
MLYCILYHINNFRNMTVYLMCSMSVHYIIQKTWNTNIYTKSFFVNYNTLLHVSTLLGHRQGQTFRCRYTRLHYTAQLYSAAQCNDNGKFLPKDDPAGPKHVGVCYNWRKNSLCICWCLMFFVWLYMFRQVKPVPPPGIESVLPLFSSQ